MCDLNLKKYIWTLIFMMVPAVAMEEGGLDTNFCESSFIVFNKAEEQVTRCRFCGQIVDRQCLRLHHESHFPNNNLIEWDSGEFICGYKGGKTPCAGRFENLANLIEHQEGHKKVWCLVLGCEQSYARSDALRKHQKEKHPNEYQQILEQAKASRSVTKKEKRIQFLPKTESCSARIVLQPCNLSEPQQPSEHKMCDCGKYFDQSVFAQHKRLCTVIFKKPFPPEIRNLPEVEELTAVPAPESTQWVGGFRKINYQRLNHEPAKRQLTPEFWEQLKEDFSGFLEDSRRE